MCIRDSYNAIKNLTLIDVDIKWVNDSYYRHKKIGGILTGAITSIETGIVTDVIIGVGLNLAISTFPDELESKDAPFNTLKNKGLVPSKSRLISLATRATSFKIRSSGMKGVKRLSLI